MKKILLIAVLVLFTLILAFGLIACGGDDNNENRLVGTWSGAVSNYTFNADGTGYMNWHGVVDEFTWSTEDNILTINVMNMESTVISFSINNDELKMYFSEEPYVFTRQ